MIERVPGCSNEARQGGGARPASWDRLHLAVARSALLGVSKPSDMRRLTAAT